jgi:plasmid stabilization system protein ParE
MRKVFWSNLARLDYFDNIDYLLQDWSEKEAQNFIDEVSDLEFLLKQGLVDFQDTDYPTVKRCVVCKQVTLFYRIIDNHNVELLRFWNNYKDKSKLML